MLAALMTIPLLSSCFFKSAPRHFRLAAERLMNLPAPWAVVPKLNSIALGVPIKTQLLVPMLPGIRTGCQRLRNELGHLDGLEGKSEERLFHGPLLLYAP